MTKFMAIISGSTRPMMHTHDLRWMSMIVALAAGAVAGAAPAARADQIVLRNGDRLSGRVTMRSSTDLTIDTELAGRVTVKVSAVSRITPSIADPTTNDAPSWHGTL